MTNATAYLIAAVSSFAVLFSVPVSISVVSSLLAASPRDPSSTTGFPSFVSDLKFAAAWSFLVFIPAAVLASAAGDTGLAFHSTAAAVSVAAFARALFGSRKDAGVENSRTLWAALEALLVFVGFLVFGFIYDVVVSAGTALA